MVWILKELQINNENPTGLRLKRAQGGSIYVAITIRQQWFVPAAQEHLLPTPTNINTIHVPRTELLNLISAQQWLLDHLGLSAPLLDGCFVLVPSVDLQHDTALLPAQQPPETQPQGGDPLFRMGSAQSGSSNSRQQISSSAGGSLPPLPEVCCATPWCLRQVAAVELTAGGCSDPRDVVLLLRGGGRVKAGWVSPDTLKDVAQYQVGAQQQSRCEDIGAVSTHSIVQPRAVLHL